MRGDKIANEEENAHDDVLRDGYDIRPCDLILSQTKDIEI